MALTEDQKVLRHKATLAQWARERAERAVDRIALKIGESSDPEKKKILTGDLKEAKSLLSERKTNEARAKKVYADSKKEKVQKVQPVEEISKSLAQMAREMVAANGGEISLGQAKKILRANGAVAA